MRQILTLVSASALVLAVAACGGDDVDDGDDTAGSATTTLVVTTNILGDVVKAVVGDLAAVEVIMPVGSDPHDFSPTVKQAATMEDADLLVINGLGFEAGMLDLIDGVADGGTPLFAFAEAVSPLEGEHTDDHEGELKSDEGPSLDPHFWTDPARMAVAFDSFVDVAARTTDVDDAALREQADAYVAELQALDAATETLLAGVPEAQRVLVTNHEVFAYFADRYGFEVVGAVVPSLTTSAETSTRELEELAELIEARGIPAIFAETTQTTQLAEALAAEVGSDVQIVELYTESLGEPGSGAQTYIGMVRTNADLVAEALGAT
jgi:zinc/manganese transport system substrate-binding protein